MYGQRSISGRMESIKRRSPMVVNAVTKEPVPVLCLSAGTCKKKTCRLKCWFRGEKCPYYIEDGGQHG